MIFWNGFEVIGFLIMAFLCAVLLILIALRNLIEYLTDKRRYGWHKHEWKLESTSSYGTKHWYRCERCNKTHFH